MTDESVFGINAVTQAIRGGGARRLIVKPGRLSSRLQQLVNDAEKLGVPVDRLDPDSVVGNTVAHQGVVLQKTGGLTSVSLEDLLEARPGYRLFLILDGVTDPGNLGACLRSAVTLGVDAVIAPKDGSAPLNADAQKRAAGGAELVPYLQVTNLARSMQQLKEAGVWIVGTQLDAQQSLSSVDFNEHIALVLGAEGTGIRQKTAKNCDFLVSIPMADARLGFNVSVATGICLYEAQRQRGG